MDIPTFNDFIQTARGYKRTIQYRQQFQRWMTQRSNEGAKIELPVHFKGVTPPFEHLDIAPGAWIERDTTIWISPDVGAEPKLTLGKDSFIGFSSCIGVFLPISIGPYAQIGAYSYIISANHEYSRRDIPIIRQGFVGAPILIEEDAWLGTHVVVLPGVTVGKGAIVAAGSVVTKNIPPYEIWGGTPAKFIKTRPD